MSPDSVLRVVAGALAEHTGKSNGSFSVTDTAAALGVEVHHVQAAIRGLRDRGLVSIASNGGISFTREQGSELKAISNSTPARMSEEDAAQRVAADVLRRIRAGVDFTLHEVASSTGVKLAHVKRAIASWNNHLESE